jgi:ribonuclease HII
MSLKSSAKALKADLAAFDAAFGVPVCGIDEVGRGPLAGPVVTACAFIPAEKLRHPVWKDVTDSKKLSPQKRDYIFEIIKSQCVYAVAEASTEEIDKLNIHHATLLAMKRAYHGVYENIQVSLALIDGKFAPSLPCKTQTVVKGDATSLSIAAASIIAKVTRDRMMAELHREYPQYGWLTNAGYGTEEHMAGIAAHGITPHHRKSFAPCKIEAA